MTDGAGSITYAYDSLSRISSETRQFTGSGAPSGNFTLSYQYNPANQPTSVTDQHSSASFSTGYDNAGRVYSVTGVGYNSTSTQFVSSASYRAWGGLKSSSYGNSTSVTLGYNSRGFITSFSSGGMGASYQYYADGQIEFAQDQSTNSEPIKDRAFSYDHAGRLKEAYSGSEARNFINNTTSAADGPFRQSYSYDVWSNLTNQNWRFWSRSGETTATYNSSNRNTAWSYDAEGNLHGRGDGAVYGYDAAGNEISQSQETGYYDWENNGTVGLFFLNTEGHDGDGQLVHYVKKMDHNFNGSTPSNSYTEDVFKLCSTVLGGRVISEYSSSGTWKVSYVYFGGERIGTQLNNGGTAYSGWRYVDPVTGDEGSAILDPQGVDVGHEDPFPADGSGDPDLQPNGSEPFKGAARMLPIEGGGTKCVLDGITMDCSFIKGEISVQCPDNDCKPKTIVDSNGKRHLAPVGFDPNTGRLGNYYWDSGYHRNQPEDDSDVVKINNRGKYVWKYGRHSSSFALQDVWLQTPFLFRDLDTIERVLQKKTCGDFLNGVLAELGRAAGRGRELSFADLFHSIPVNAFRYDPNLKVIAHASPDGILIGNSAFTIKIRAPYADHAPYELIHEITHGAPTEGNNYTHLEMANAAYNVAERMGLIDEKMERYGLKGVKPNPNEALAKTPLEARTINNSNSGLFTGLVIKACRDSK